MVRAITYIIRNGTTGALIGDNLQEDTKKVYPVIGTQTERMPLVTVRLAGRVPEFCRGQRPTTFNYSYEVYVYAKSYDQIEQISSAIIDDLETQSIASIINSVRFTDRIRNTNMVDGDYVEEYKAYQRVVSFSSVVDESQTT